MRSKGMFFLVLILILIMLILLIAIICSVNIDYATWNHQGLVFGCLTVNGDLDTALLKSLISAARWLIARTVLVILYFLQSKASIKIFITNTIMIFPSEQSNLASISLCTEQSILPAISRQVKTRWKQDDRDHHDQRSSLHCDQDRDHLHLDHLDDHHTGVCSPGSRTWVHADSHKWGRRHCSPGQKRCRDIFLQVFLLIIIRRWKTSLIRALLQLRS